MKLAIFFPVSAFVEDDVLDNFASYHASRNMPLKEPEEERFVQWREIKDKKGYYLDKDTYYEGTNKFTGYKYRYYTMIKLNRRI